MDGGTEPYARVFHPTDDRFTVTGLDFTITYLRVRELAREATPNSPQAVGYVAAFARVLERAEHDRQKNSRYVYREAAQGLCVFLRPEAPADLSRLALKTLLRSCSGGTTGVRLAVARVLGELDMGLPACPDCSLPPLTNSPSIPLRQFLAKQAASDIPPHWLGRTLVTPSAQNPSLVLAIKFLRHGEQPECLQREAAWMHRLADMHHHFSGRFAVPTPLGMGVSPVCRIHDAGIADLHPGNWALCYLASPDYFAYPNDERPGKLPPPEDFLEIMGRNARHMGTLMALGLTHTAPIPLFHNRVQQGRRRDAGTYQWHRMGRLDQWLASCRHPNFGLSGLRDFEHIEPHQRQGTDLYHAMGTTLLSLFLVTGSYFRFSSPELTGLDAHNRPVDARHLFDAELLRQVMQTIQTQFYKGFAGHDMPFTPNFDLPGLCARMIEEMGVDRHMAEVLRMDDQKEMTDREFTDFLASRGFTEKDTAALQRGRKDVTVLTGPHLGGFNRPISLPELVEFTASSVGLACAGRYAGLMIPHTVAVFADMQFSRFTFRPQAATFSRMI